MKYYFLFLLPLLIGCSSNSGTKSEGENDSVAEQADTLSSESAVDDYDWTPEEFKKEHPDEWAVVKPSINVQQKDGDIDFGMIDVLVNDYIAKKKIPLPSKVNERIELIAELCRTKFDISGYDDSNMGMHIADGTSRLFDMYINWLYEKEAKEALSHNRLVDIEREFELYENLNDAMYDVCGSVASCFGGSGTWIGASQIRYISIVFREYMCKAILGAKLDHKRGLDVPLELFDKECQMLIDNYKPYDDEQPIDPSPVINKFKNAFHSWYAYRKSTAASMKNSRFKRDYEAITYSFARKQFVHLKNRYSDIGMMSTSMLELCIDDSCSNQDLLNFNYETRRKELFGDL